MTVSHETLANLAASPREIVLLGVKPNLPSSTTAETSIVFLLQDRSASLRINVRVELLPGGHGFQLLVLHVRLYTTHGPVKRTCGDASKA